MAITEQGAINDFWFIKPDLEVHIEGDVATFTASIFYADEEE